MKLYSGNVVENYSYDVYGNILNYTDSLIRNDIYFTGREFEKEIGLYYNRARYYNPETGRFISRDPIDIVDDINLYAYVGNNPIGFVDLMGTEKKLIEYMLGDEYIKILREKGSIAGIDAIFIEAKKLSNNDIDSSTEWFYNVLKPTNNEKLLKRQPRNLGDLGGSDKIYHFSTSFHLTYNNGIDPVVTDLLGITWEVKDTVDLITGGEGYGCG